MGRKPKEGSKNGTSGQPALAWQGQTRAVVVVVMVELNQFREISADTGGKGSCKLHFFLAADLVTFPWTSFFSTVLMTPTATVCFMSRTAKRPRGA